MLLQDEIKKIVESKIRKDEFISDYEEGAENNFDQNFEIIEINEPVKTDKGYLINYKYITIVFSGWPSFSPIEYMNQKSIIVDEKYNIIEETEKVTTFLGGGNFFNLEMF
jgi:hypothetical protein